MATVAKTDVVADSGRVGLTPTSRCEVSRRGPNWLFVQLDAAGLTCGLGERLWRMAQQQFTYRLVLEFDRATDVDPRLGIELGWLCHRLDEAGGALRLCGLPPQIAEAVLAEADCPRLHNHTCEQDAVLGQSCVDTVVMTNAPRRPR